MQAGTTLRNRYRILQKLGSDCFGDTYLAQDCQKPGKPRCVVKQIKPKTNDPEAMLRGKRLLEAEAKTFYKLGNQSDRPPLDSFIEGGQFYLVREFIEGLDLGEEITPRRGGSDAGSGLVSTPPPLASPTLTKRRSVLLWLVLGWMGFAGPVFGKGFWDGGTASRDSGESPEARRNNRPRGRVEPIIAGYATTTFSFTTVKVNREGEIIERVRAEAQVLAENLGNGVSLEMVSIPGGSFMMGSPEDEEGRNDYESPQHRVNVPAFFLGKHPVTQAQYEAVMGENPSGFPGAKRPVETVSWNQATEFCRRLSQKTGKIYRLPSEAEWEYACRAGTTTAFHFGPTITTDLANYWGTSTYASEPEGVYRQKTTDVGSFPPNAFGLYDMHGNVSEWCQDVWHFNYNGAPSDGSAWESGGDSSRRPLRGGSWGNYPGYCRSAYRFWDDAEGYVDAFRGLRVVLWMPQEV